MGSSFEKYQKRRLISSYFSVVVSIALVLFLLGILGVLLINAKIISDEFKEKVVLTIYLEDASKPIEINQLKNFLWKFLGPPSVSIFCKNDIIFFF